MSPKYVNKNFPLKIAYSIKTNNKNIEKGVTVEL